MRSTTPRPSRQSTSRPQQPAVAAVAAAARAGWLPWRSRLSAVALLVGVGLAVYANSFTAAFVFDGAPMPRDFATMGDSRQAAAATMRPVATLSFWLEFRLHGAGVLGFHVVNLAIHLAAAITLLEIVRLTLVRGRLAAIYAGESLPLALTVALLWMVHPLQTESVTYIYQRYESLMGLFSLLCVYGFVRAVDARRPWTWYAASATCWLLAMGSKEVAVVVPAALLWYDPRWCRRRGAELLARRWAFYGVLAAIAGAGAAAVWARRAWYAGGGVLTFDRVSALEYARSQPGVLLHYLRLALWPQGQCADYDWPVAQTAGEIVGPLVVVVLLLGLTVWCVFRRPAWGFLGGWFFLTLLPTSSVAPIVDLAVEHRMYLALAAVVAAAVFAVHGLLLGSKRSEAMPATLRRGVCVGLAIVGVCAWGATTAARNTVYGDELTFWSDVAAKSPRNVRARIGVAAALNAAGRYEEAAEQALVAVKLNSSHAMAHNHLGFALAKLGRIDLALAAYREANRLDPEVADIHLNLGNALRFSDPQAAIAEYRKAIALRPHFVEAHSNLGNLLQVTAPAEAEEQYLAALAFEPGHAETHNNLASLLARQGRWAEALEHYRAALRWRPDFPEAQQGMQVVEQMMKRDQVSGSP